MVIETIPDLEYHFMEGEKQDRLLTIAEICDLLHVKRSFIYSLTRARKIPYIRIQGLLRFRLSAIESWLAEREVSCR